jgi:nucleoside-diphosphate-sugar epimerase
MRVGTVLVTGAFGQIGKRCVEILLNRGRTVIATDLRNPGTVAAAEAFSEMACPGTLVPVYADLLDSAAIRQLVTDYQPGAIVHLAAMYSPPSYRNPRLARKINVEGTRILVDAAKSLPVQPLLLKASSAAVYGSRNPYRHPERITTSTPVDPIDQYGEDKVLAEVVIGDSGLSHAVLRLAGVISPDGASSVNSDYLVLMRSMPRDNRLHTVDARDAGLAFANAVDRGGAIDGKVLLIAGNETHVRLHSEVQDDVMAALGLGRLGPSVNLPGDPDDDRGWSFTGWFDTTESQTLLDFQQHDWSETLAWMAESQRLQRHLLRTLGPVLRPAMRAALRVQRRVEHRGRYADPWTLIEKHYGPDVLATTRA